MGIKALIKRLLSKEITITGEDAAKYGMMFVLDIKGNPVDPGRVFDAHGNFNPGFVPVKWRPPVLIIYTPEKLPVSFPTIPYPRGF